MGMLVTHRSNLFGLDKKHFLGDGVVTGYGTVNGRLVYVFSQDFTVLGGSLAEAHAEKICRVMDLALDNGAPVIGLNDSGGARIQEGVVSLRRLCGHLPPQRAGERGGAADQCHPRPVCRRGGVQPGIDRFHPDDGGHELHVRDRAQCGQDGDPRGGDGGGTRRCSDPRVQERGGAPDRAPEVAAIDRIKELLDYLPQNCEETPASKAYAGGDESRPKLDGIIPENAQQPYDMRDVVKELVDGGEFLEEIQPDFAANIVVGFARLGGRSIGVVANQPAVLAGVLDIGASTKAARFVRTCDAFNVPLLVLEDVPGFLPGTDQEWNGIITNGAKLLYAFSEATVPRITVITRKAYGGAYDVMNSKHIGADLNFAWPTAEIAVMGAKGAAEIIFRKEIASADDPAAKLAEKEAEYAELFAHPYRAAARGYVDEVIVPSNTRKPHQGIRHAGKQDRPSPASEARQPPTLIRTFFGNTRAGVRVNLTPQHKTTCFATSLSPLVSAP